MTIINTTVAILATVLLTQAACATTAAVAVFCGCEVACYDPAAKSFFGAEIPDATAEQCAEPPQSCYTRPLQCRGA